MRKETVESNIQSKKINESEAENQINDDLLFDASIKSKDMTKEILKDLARAR